MRNAPKLEVVRWAVVVRAEAMGGDGLVSVVIVARPRRWPGTV